LGGRISEIVDPDNCVGRDYAPGGCEIAIYMVIKEICYAGGARGGDSEAGRVS
jgi:hypothetical protein